MMNNETQVSLPHIQLSFPELSSSLLPSVSEVPLTEIRKNAQKKGQLLERYLVDENLGEVERAEYLLTKGTSVQKCSVLENLPSLFQRHQQKAISKIVTLFSDKIGKEDEETQIMIGDYLVPCFPLLPPENMKEVFALIQSMINNSGEHVASVWQDVLISAVDFMSTSLLENEIIPFAIQKGSLSETESNRCFCSKLLGSLSKRLPFQTIKQLYLQKSLDLCQDTSFSVRKTMAQEIINLSKGLGPEKSKQYLMPELIQLVKDETKLVRQAALETLTNMLSFFDEKYRADQIQQYYLNWIKSPPSDLYRILVERLGEIFYYLQIKEEDQISCFVNFFVSASKDNSQEIREFCAFNFPAIVKCVGSKRYEKCLHNSMVACCEDPSGTVRKRIASGFHEIVKLLSEDGTAKLLKNLFFSLLSDTNMEVRDKIVQNLNTILTCFKTALAKTSDSFFTNVISSINNYHSGVQNDWRRLENFFSHFQYFHLYFSREQIIDTFIPILKKQIFEGVAQPVKIQAATSLVIVTRGLQSLPRQKDILSSLIKDLISSRSYSNRMMFFDLCIPIMEHYSKKFSKELLFENVMKMEKDKVPNVRRRFCFMLPELKKTLTLPDDVILLAKIKEKLSYLSLDKDKDVKEAAMTARNILHTIETETNRGFRLNLQSADEIADKKKEKEETEWTDREYMTSVSNTYSSNTSSPTQVSPPSTSISSMRRKSIPNALKPNITNPSSNPPKSKSPSPSPTPYSSSSVKPKSGNTISRNQSSTTSRSATATSNVDQSKAKSKSTSSLSVNAHSIPRSTSSQSKH